MSKELPKNAFNKLPETCRLTEQAQKAGVVVLEGHVFKLSYDERYIPVTSLGGIIELIPAAAEAMPPVPAEFSGAVSSVSSTQDNAVVQSAPAPVSSMSNADESIVLSAQLPVGQQEDASADVVSSQGQMMKESFNALPDGYVLNAAAHEAGVQVIDGYLFITCNNDGKTFYSQVSPDAFAEPAYAGSMQPSADGVMRSLAAVDLNEEEDACAASDSSDDEDDYGACAIRYAISSEPTSWGDTCPPVSYSEPSLPCGSFVFACAADDAVEEAKHVVHVSFRMRAINENNVMFMFDAPAGDVLPDECIAYATKLTGRLVEGGLTVNTVQSASSRMILDVQCPAVVQFEVTEKPKEKEDDYYQDYNWGVKFKAVLRFADSETRDAVWREFGFDNVIDGSISKDGDNGILFGVDASMSQDVDYQ